MVTFLDLVDAAAAGTLRLTRNFITLMPYAIYFFAVMEHGFIPQRAPLLNLSRFFLLVAFLLDPANSVAAFRLLLSIFSAIIEQPIFDKRMVRVVGRCLFYMSRAAKYHPTENCLGAPGAHLQPKMPKTIKTIKNTLKHRSLNIKASPA